MKIFGLSDTHLSISIPDKTMEVFGNKWKDYINRLESNWNETVKKEDIVIIPGDISWCTKLNETYEDFKFLNNLNGYKLISKGNHDYWFSTKKKVMDYFSINFPSLELIERRNIRINNYNIIGFKGFNSQIDKSIFDKQLTKQYNSLELFLKQSKMKFNIPIILSYHFPPLYNENNKFHELFKKYNVQHCLYGHIHIDYNQCFTGLKDTVNYHFVAADYLEFKPKLILEL